MQCLVNSIVPAVGDADVQNVRDYRWTTRNTPVEIEVDLEFTSGSGPNVALGKDNKGQRQTQLQKQIPFGHDKLEEQRQG